MMYIPFLALAAMNSKSVAPPVTDLLRTGFNNPPASAKPWTWWHWINGNASKAGITADLEAMKRVGVHGFQVFNVDQNFPEGSASYMTPHWLELFKFAVSEANRLGLEMGFHNAAGWSSSGGPWITPENAMQTVVTSETSVTGGHAVRLALAQPKTNLNFYRDIAVLAFPKLSGNEKVDSLPAKSLSGADFQYELRPDAKVVATESVVPKSAIIDLTSKMSARGELNWDAPAGEWTVLRVGYTPRGEKNHPAGIGGLGLECDKLSRAGLDAHWANGVEPILKQVQPYIGKSLTNCLIDSYEVGACDWTPKFREEFLKRRGYDITPFLPVLSGHYVQSGEVTERFLWDVRRTVGDLYAENYYDYFCDLCKKHDLMSCIEPYDGPYEGLEVASKVGMPMGEFWVGGMFSMASVKLAASVAHVRGSSIVGTESFTADGQNSKWLHHPATLKALGDYAWTLGSNRFVFHSTTHQPWMNVVPGMTFHMYGTSFGRLNTWWEQSKPWMDYLARSQFLLQQGRCAADVLFFGGEESPASGVYRPELKALGYEYDAIGTGGIYSLRVKGGTLFTPGGAQYRVLVLPTTTWMTPKLLRQIKSLATAGATIVGTKPTKSPSLQGFPACDSEVSKLADEIWGQGSGENTVGKGRIISNRSAEQVLADLKVAPDFAVQSPNSHLAFIHRIVKDADVYFVSNQESRSQNVDCAFRVAGKNPEIWNPETGRTFVPAAWHEQNGSTVVPISLEATGSAFVVFRKTPKVDPIIRTEFNLAPAPEIPLPNVHVVRAVYGAFPHYGMIDVSDALIKRTANGRLQVAATNDLAGDPTPGAVKELRVEYTLDGVTKLAAVPENQELKLPLVNETGVVTVKRAYYGKFDGDMPGMPPQYRNVDVTERLAAIVDQGKLSLHVDNGLFGFVPDSLVHSELRVDYTVDGDPQHVEASENSDLHLNLEPPQPCLSVEGGRVLFSTPQNGNVNYTTASGVQKTLTVSGLPDPLEIKGAWDVQFQEGRGAPAKATFDQLLSWPHHQDLGIRYFSGTATYRKNIQIPAEYLAQGRSLELDLGRVAVVAQVKLNGKDLGVLWKAPFRVSLDSAAKVGANELEIQITNLWPNRLIRDAQFPDDLEWNGATPKQWPDWLVKGEPRPATERITFTTWRHWSADSPLLPSGLLGPVVLRTYGQAQSNP